MTNQRADQAKTGPAAASWWLPSLPVWIFVVLLTWLFHYAGAAQQLLGDGDAGWHILTGEYVLNHLALPATDPFSFTMEGRAWYAWEWLADVVFALAHRFDGLEGVVLLTGAVIAATGALTLRFLLWSGANLFLAALGSIFVSAVSTSHWLARPHIFTWGLFIATLWLLESDRRANSWRIWLLAPLVAVWVNVHGGFVAALVTVAIFGFGVGLEQWVAAYRRSPGACAWFLPPAWLRYGALFGACLAATLMNPYGWKLHAHIAEYLRSDFILKHVDEFQAPDFRSESSKLYEAALLAGLVAAGRLLARGRFAWSLLVVAWAHASLTSARHMSLFMIIAAPVVALELTKLIAQAARAGNSVFQTLVEIGDDYGSNVSGPIRWSSFAPNWLTLGALVAVAWTLNARASDPVNQAVFPPRLFPAAAQQALGERLEGRRVLTSDQWGDYLVYQLHPRFKVFIDGRSDFFDRAVLEDYMKLLSARNSWAATLEKYEFDAILAPADWSLVGPLKLSPAWRLVYDDGAALYFERRSAPAGSIEVASEPGRELSAFLEYRDTTPGDALRSP